MGEQVHKCPVCNKGITIIPGQDINITINLHLDSKDCKPEQFPQCPKCRIRLTGINSVACNRCKQKLCLTHRFSDQHECVHPLERKVNAMGFKCPKCQNNFPKSGDLITHMRVAHIQTK